MTMPALLFVVLALGLIAWLVTRARAIRFAQAKPLRAGALPSHHAWFAALWAVVPAMAFVVAWSSIAPALATDAVLDTPGAATLPPAGFTRGVVLADARRLAHQPGFAVLDPVSARLAPAYAAADARMAWTGTAITLLLVFATGGAAVIRIRPLFRARRRIERGVMALLLVASLIAILATAGIVASLLAESARFFRVVPITDFLFGRHWDPQVIDPADPGASLGAAPLFWGTFFIGAVIAMLVAIPFGLMSAVYLTQYASPRARFWIKPLLEILAGIPTVVYGYFAALTVAPAVRRFGLAIGMADPSSESALAAGLVIGVMIIPFVSSMADDSLAAVPTAMRDASLAMGATSSETIRHVLLPAALPGIVGGVLLAISRAVGETMIVVMAASGVATLSLDPFASATTVTRQIVDLLTGEAAFDSPKTLSAFALGLTLFAITLLLNTIALGVVRRYRESYE